jgi:hypothetical protein
MKNGYITSMKSQIATPKAAGLLGFAIRFRNHKLLLTTIAIICYKVEHLQTFAQ